MSQVHLKATVNVLNDEENLAQSLPSIISAVAAFPSQDADAATLNKFHAKISSLLQSKSSQTKWCGVCLAKAALSRPDGRWDTLVSHGSTWIKLLLRILEHEVNEVVIERILATITMIVAMTEGKPALSRDLTTSALPTLFTHIFAHLERQGSPQLTKHLLYHMRGVLVRYPASFRSFASRLQAFTTGLINGSTSDPVLIDLAARSFASLQLCAPKNTSSEQWTTGLAAIIGSCHASLSYIYQPVAESSFPLPIPDGLELLPFTSDYTSQVSLAIRRLTSLITTLKAFIELPARDTTKVPVGQLAMLTTRLLKVTPRTGIKASTPQSTQIALLSCLPELHALGFDLYETFCLSLGGHLYPYAEELQRTCLRELQTESNYYSQAIARTALSKSLVTFGFFIYEDATVELTKSVRTCLSILSKLQPSKQSSIVNDGAANGKLSSKKRKHNSQNGSDRISDSDAFHTLPSQQALDSSCDLLEAVLLHTHSVLSKGTRQQVDLLLLRFLSVPQSMQIPVRVLVRLLKLLKVSLTSPESGPSASAMLTATITVVQDCVNHHEPEVRRAADLIRDDMELFIHPRFPAVRRRIRQQEIDEQEKEDLMEEEEISNDMGAKEGELTGSRDDSIEATSNHDETEIEETIQADPDPAQYPAIPDLSVQDAIPIPPMSSIASLPLPTPLTEKLLSEQFPISNEESAPKRAKIEQPYQAPKYEEDNESIGSIPSLYTDTSESEEEDVA